MIHKSIVNHIYFLYAKMETAQQDVGARTYTAPPELDINTDKIVSVLE